ncbi:MAG: hypothetical protein AB7V13_18420 [Pseudorhodoplanes sp.]
MARYRLASGKPDERQCFHPQNQAIEHGDAKGASRYKWMQANIEILAPLSVLLQKGGPPNFEDVIWIHHSLGCIFGVHPGKTEKHRVIDCEVKRQVEESARFTTIEEKVRAIIRRLVRVVEKSLVDDEQLACMPAPCADRPPAR